jgi:hypothetical protein
MQSTIHSNVSRTGGLLRQDSSDIRPFYKTSKNSISRFWFLVARRKRCYFELIIVRAERAYQESGV